MVTLRNGDILRVLATFRHVGQGVSNRRLRAAIGTTGAFFDEKLFAEIAVPPIPDEASWTIHQYTLDIPITNVGTFNFPGGPYELYCKLFSSLFNIDLVWYGPQDDIILEEATVGEPQFHDLQVVYQKA